MNEEDRAKPSTLRRLASHVTQDIDTSKAFVPLTLMCVITGYIDAVSFTATYIWPGFQTGNCVQLGIATARLFSPGPDQQFGFRYPDALALTSLLSFNVGAFATRFWPLSIASYKSKAFAVSTTFVMAVITCFAGVCLHFGDQPSFAGDRGEPAWTNVLGFVTMAFISFTMGAQGILGTRLSSPYATTVVITSVFCNLAIEPALFTVSRLVPSREQKVLAILAAFVGGIFARSIMPLIGASNALFVGAGLRAVCAALWLVSPTKPREQPKSIEAGKK